MNFRKEKKQKYLLFIPILVMTCVLSLLFVTEKEVYHADVSGNCASHVTGYTCPGHGHAWEAPSTCYTCGGDHKVASGTSTCTNCKGKGYTPNSNVSVTSADYTSVNFNYCGMPTTTQAHYHLMLQGCKNCGGSGYIYYYSTSTFTTSNFPSKATKGRNSSYVRGSGTVTTYSDCTMCYANGTNTRCTNASWSGCGKGSYAAWSDYPNGTCYTDNCTPVYGAHVSNGTYQYNGANHWTNCSYCGGTIGTTAHSYGAEWTSGGYRYQSCGCGYIRGNGAITYTIVYHGNGATGGSTAASGHTYDIGAYLTGNGFYRTGYTFLGWSTDANATSHSYNNGQTIANLTQTHGGTVNLYAIWKANSYTVSFNANGGTNGSLSSVKTTYNTSNYYSHGNIVPTRTGYTFLGWYTAVNGGSLVYNANGVCVNGTGYWSGNKWVYTNSITLYAHWQRNIYTITYNGNGGTVTTGSKTNYYNEAVDLTGVKAQKNGYVFTGWNTNPNAKEPLQTYTMPNGNLTLYAIYSIPISDVEGVYLVAWPSENTDAHHTVALEKTDTQNMMYTYHIGMTNLSGITNTSSNSYALVSYDNAGNYSILKQTAQPPELDWYVQTVNHYKYDSLLKDWVWFDTTSELKISGETFTPSYLDILPSGYEQSYIDGAYVVAGDKVSNAYYKPITYQITFEPNGGTVEPASKEIVYQDVYGELPTPKREGYTFTGWYTEKESGSKVISSTKYETASDSSLYAHWKINKHNVIYDYWTNGGDSVSVELENINYGSEIDLTVKANKYGWEFIGWNTNPDATEGLSSIKLGDEDLVLYAIYKKNITATFIDSNHANTRIYTITIYNQETECQILVPELTSLSLYTTLGWSLDTSANALIHASGGSNYTLSDNATFYGCYVQDITIHYDTNGSAEEILSQTKERYYNSSGNYLNPTFTLATAPKLDKHSFVQWEELDAEGNTSASYNANQELELSQNLLLTARWDKHPEIESYDRYFTLDEAVNGEITEDRLLEKVTATDREDGTLTNGKDVIIQNLEQYDFIHNTDVTITYQAKDSFGNVIEKTITIHVIDTTVTKSPITYYSRFINPDFYSDGVSFISEENGGLESTSIWRIDATYQRLLEHALTNEAPLQTYIFTKEELKEFR